MFDIGFGELLVCAIIALLVLGPERLPGAVRTVGRWVGRARHTVNNFTDQIDREIRAEELKKRIEEEMKKVGIDDISRQVKDALHAPLPLIGADHLRDTVDDAGSHASAHDDTATISPAHSIAPTEPAPVNSIAPPALQASVAGVPEQLPLPAADPAPVPAEAGKTA